MLTDYSGFKVNEDSTWHVFAGSSLAEECVEGVVSTSNGLVTRHLTIRLDAMLQTVQLPAGVAHLDSGLADMDADAFTLQPPHPHHHVLKSTNTTTILFVKYTVKPMRSLNLLTILTGYHSVNDEGIDES